ncbi:MAG: integrase core domain-containing protein [Anaerolineales bacterium]
MTKIILAWELLEQGLPKAHVAKHLGVSRRTVIRWSQAFEQHGSLTAFLDRYQRAKRGPRRKRKRDAVLQRRIWTLRRKHRHCCGQKLQYFLEKEYGQTVSVTTIYKVLGEQFKLRSKWQKNQIRGPVPRAQRPRQVLQVDTVDFGEVFAFVAVDIFSKEGAVRLSSSLEAKDGQLFLGHCFPRIFGPFVDVIQTDGGPEFKGAFAEEAKRYCHRHRVARPYRKNEQSFVESFNRSLRKECLGWAKYKVTDIPNLSQELHIWLQYYHYERPHLSLHMRPPLQLAGVTF